MSAPVGPTGCEGDHEHQANNQWFAGASYGQFASSLSFSNDAKPDIVQQMVVAAVGRRIGADHSVRLAVGAILGGSLTVGGERHEVGTGVLVTIAISRRWLFAGRFFATGSISAGVSATSTRLMGIGEAVGLQAGDVRVGGIVGATLWNRISPYALARGFGGPVFWSLNGDDITGSDQHHYQVGAGLSAQLVSGLSALVDASLLGERSLSIGLSYTL